MISAETECSDGGGSVRPAPLEAHAQHTVVHSSSHRMALGACPCAAHYSILTLPSATPSPSPRGDVGPGRAR